MNRDGPCERRQRRVDLQDPRHTDADGHRRQCQQHRGERGGCRRLHQDPESVGVSAAERHLLMPFRRERPEAGNGRLQHIIEALDSDQRQRQEQHHQGASQQQLAKDACGKVRQRASQAGIPADHRGTPPGHGIRRRAGA
jgi:hypothetical protein